MKVLIGIISKNRAKILPKAIQSALDQDYGEKEVAVFDDASMDETRLLVNHFPTVHWQFSGEPKGYLYARNKFMRETKAEFYCSLDDDSWFLGNDSLRVAVNYLNQHPEVGAIAFDIVSPDKPALNGKGAPYEVNMFIGCGHLLRLSAVKELGYYTPNPGFYGGEEKDLSIRLMNRNLKIIRLPGVHVWHDKTMVARDLPKQHRSGVCNDLVFAWRRVPMPQLLLILPGKVLSHFRFAVKNRMYFKSYIKGLFDFVLVWHRILKSRLPVSIQTYRHFQTLS